MGCVYEITFPDDSRYIGMTTQSLKRRLKSHKDAAKKYNQSPIQKKITSIGFDYNWATELGSVEDTEVLELLEIEFIAQRRQQGFDVLNRANGGKGNFGVKHSEEVNEKNRLRLQGSKHKRSKLTEETAVNILTRASNGESRTELAKEHSVSKGLVDLLCRGKIWKHIDRSCFPMPPRRSTGRLSQKQVLEARKLMAEGVSQPKIGELLGVSQGTISNIKDGTCYAWIN